MARLTTEQRKNLPASDFAGPNRTYPDQDHAHAVDALSRVAANGSPALQSEVRRNVHAKYPGIQMDNQPKKRMHVRHPDGSVHEHIEH